MASFKALIIEHGYTSIAPERAIIGSAGGEVIDGSAMPLEKACQVAAEVEAVMVRRIPITADLIKTFRKCKILLRFGVGVDNLTRRPPRRVGAVVLFKALREFPHEFPNVPRHVLNRRLKIEPSPARTH